MIRFAVPDDLPDVVMLGERFHEQTSHAEHIRFDHWSFRNFCERLIKDCDSTLIVTNEVDGMGASMAFPCWFNVDVLTAAEMWVYTERPGTGPALFKALEQWAQGIGAKTNTITSQNRLKDVSKLYQRLGYEPTERLYTKRL